METAKILPVKIDKMDMVLGGKAMEILPKWDDIPEDFRRERGEARKFCEFVSQWFFKGADANQLRVKPGIDMTMALANLKCCLASFAPKHEHKEAGCAYLLSLWFDLA